MFKKIKNLILSLLVVGKHLFKCPVTLEYPEKKNIIPENFRGKLYVEKCIGCKNCTKACPTGAISIEENNGKKIFNFDLKKCIFCGNCSFYCPVGGIKMSNEYELATTEKNELKLTCIIGGSDERN